LSDLDIVIKGIRTAVKLAGASPADRTLAWLSAAAPHLVEDLGPNEGTVLSPLLVDRYRAFWQVPKGISLPWCAIVGLAAQMVGLGHLPSSLEGAEDLAIWKKHPVGSWDGATWRIEREAKGLGLLSSTPSPGALGLMPRKGSGSDPITPVAGKPDGYYSGHTDVVIGCTADEAQVWAGNVSDSLTQRSRPLSVYRGFVPLVS